MLDEADAIQDTLSALQSTRPQGAEIIVVDGGSADQTVEIATPLCDVVLSAPRGRASQMNAGASRAVGSILLFLHADTQLPENAIGLITNALRAPGASWGRFDVYLDSPQYAFRMIEFFMNVRSSWTGIATGDQAVFIKRVVFEDVGRFPDIPLMEDIELSTRLKRIARPVCIRTKVITSTRRWERNGVLRTAIRMWALRFSYWLGADPALLAARYGYRPRDT